MERKFLLNYKALDDYLNEQQKNPDRTDGEITMLRDNCKNNLAENLLNPKEIIITINGSTWDISINWQKDLQDKFDMLPIGYKMNNKSRLYRQIRLSMESAKKLWIYDQIFKEIKE